MYEPYVFHDKRPENSPENLLNKAIYKEHIKVDTNKEILKLVKYIYNLGYYHGHKDGTFD